MPNSYTFAVHGINFFPELTGHSGPLINLPGTDYVDVVGFPQGFGKTFRGKANRQNWFHVAPPSLGMYNHGRVRLTMVTVRFQTFDTAFISNIHLHSGESPPIAGSRSGLRLQGDFRNRYEQNVISYNPGIILGRGALCISILVNFGNRDSNVQFFEAVATFLTDSNANAR